MKRLLGACTALVVVLGDRTTHAREDYCCYFPPAGTGNCDVCPDLPYTSDRVRHLPDDVSCEDGHSVVCCLADGSCNILSSVCCDVLQSLDVDDLWDWPYSILACPQHDLDGFPICRQSCSTTCGDRGTISFYTGEPQGPTTECEGHQACYSRDRSACREEPVSCCDAHSWLPGPPNSNCCSEETKPCVSLVIEQGPSC